MQSISAFGGRRWWLTVGLAAGFSGLVARAEETNAPAPAANYSAFQIVSDRNIFNPNRYARSGPRTYTPRVTRRSTSFTLAGIMSYGAGETPGTYAFFDGSNSDLRKVLQQDGTIANFKVTAITFDTVTLQNDTNQLILKVGMQMRQESAGHWVLASATGGRSSYDESGGEPHRGFTTSGSSNGEGMTASEGSDTNAVASMTGADMGDQPEAPAGDEPAPDAPPTLALPPGPASDALQRLMLLRQQEEQRTGNR